MAKTLRYIWATVAVVILWWLLAAAISSPALPTPLQTLEELCENIGVIIPQFGISLWRLLLGMFIGTVIGAPIGLLLGGTDKLDGFLSPILYILYPVPKIVFLPVLFVFFGLGGEAKVILIAIAVMFQMMVTMRDAAKAVPQSVSIAMRSLCASRWQIFKEAVVPSTLPDLFTALRVSTATAVAILFIAESMAGSTGLGYFIMHSWSLLEYAKMFSGIAAMAVMGVFIYELFDFLEKRLSRQRA